MISNSILVLFIKCKLLNWWTKISKNLQVIISPVFRTPPMLSRLTKSSWEPVHHILRWYSVNIRVSIQWLSCHLISNSRICSMFYSLCIEERFRYVQILYRYQNMKYCSVSVLISFLNNFQFHDPYYLWLCFVLNSYFKLIFVF